MGEGRHGTEVTGRWARRADPQAHPPFARAGPRPFRARGGKYVLALAFALLAGGCDADPGGATAPPPQAPPAPGGAAAGEPYQVVALEEAGAILATVRLEGPVPNLPPISPTNDRATCHAAIPDPRLVVDPETNGIKNAVVSLPAIRRGRSLARVDRTLDQRGCLFLPHVTGMTVEGRLTITNSDPIVHNTSIRAESFNETQPPGAEPRVKTMKKKGRFKVACNLHEWMTAWVIVSDTPYAGVTDQAGLAELTGVPPGSHVLEVWHELLAPNGKRLEVDVKKGEPAKVMVALASLERTR